MFCLGLRTADFTLSICQVASIIVHRDILSLGLLRSLWFVKAPFVPRQFRARLRCLTIKKLFFLFRIRNRISSPSGKADGCRRKRLRRDRRRLHKVWRCRRRLPRPPVLSAVPKNQGSYRFRRHWPSGQHQPRRERRILAFRAQFRQVCDEIKTVVVFFKLLVLNSFRWNTLFHTVS